MFALRSHPMLQNLESRDTPAPVTVPAWDDGEMVVFKMNNEHVTGVDHGALDGKVAIPLYAFGQPGSQLQADVISADPGEAGYSPWWEVIQVTINDGRDVSVNPYTSAEELEDAAASGAVTLIETDFIFLCQVLPGVGNSDDHSHKGGP